MRAAAPFQRISDQIDIAARLAELSETPIGIRWSSGWPRSAPRREGVLAALPATTPQQTAERHVTAFLAGQLRGGAGVELIEVALGKQTGIELVEVWCGPRRR